VAKIPHRDAVSSEVVRILRDVRQRQDISMTRLAETAGLSQGMISLIEHEHRNPSLDTLLRICGALHMDLSEVLAKAEKRARSSARRA